MTNEQWIMVAAIIVGPTISVCISLWIQTRSARRQAKFNSFYYLMARRKGVLDPTRLDALNTIDVIWAKHKTIPALWHEYYSVLKDDPYRSVEDWNHAHIRLLHEMAKDLGYNIEQIDIDKFYSPEGIATQSLLDSDIQKEWLRVLKNTSKIETKR